MSQNEEIKPGHKDNPIQITHPSQARANVSYVLVKEEAADGEAVSPARSKDIRKG